MRIVAVGTIKEQYLRTGIEYYLDQLNRKHQVIIQEVAESKIPQKAGNAEIEKAVALESEKIIRLIKPSAKIILLDTEGRMLSSPDLKSTLNTLSDAGRLELCFVIGGSHGVQREKFAGRAFSLSFSKMTYPHQLIRLVLLEQLCRIYN